MLNQSFSTFTTFQDEDTRVLRSRLCQWLGGTWSAAELTRHSLTPHSLAPLCTVLLWGRLPRLLRLWPPCCPPVPLVNCLLAYSVLIATYSQDLLPGLDPRRVGTPAHSLTQDWCVSMVSVLPLHQGKGGQDR